MVTCRPDSSAEFTYLDGIMPGQNYSFCVQGKTVNTSAVGILQLSEMSCTFIATGKVILILV